MAAQGFGLAVLPRSFAEFEGPPLAIRPLKPAMSLDVFLMWRSGRSHSPAAKAFLDFVSAEAR